MKTLFIPLEKQEVRINQETLESLKKLPKKLFLAYTIQYYNIAKQIKQELSKTKQILGFKQVLGCTKMKTKAPVLLIGSGSFHILNLALNNNLDTIYVYTAGKITKLDKIEIEKQKAKRKTALTKFYSADKIGILVSTKPGQQQLEKAKKLKNQLEKQGKKTFIFLADNINTQELENFDIQAWLNTACPGLTLDSNKIVNIDDIENL